MSFGFLTESALLPSKGKKIQVDGRSMVGLKAIVYEREQQLKMDKGEDEAGGSNLRSLRGKRAAEMLTEGAQRTRKDIFMRTNKGVNEREQKDKKLRDSTQLTDKEREERSQVSLKAKAKLYGKMARGEVLKPQGSGILVEFSEKADEEIYRKDGNFENGYESDKSEIIDEFGRSILVKKSSSQYKEYKRFLTTTSNSSNSNKVSSEVHYGQGQWVWSDGSIKHADTKCEDNRFCIDNSEDTYIGRREMTALLDEESKNIKSNADVSFRLRDRWEGKLGQQDKDYIEILRGEGEDIRAKGGSKKDAKKERLEMLRRKTERKELNNEK